MSDRPGDAPFGYPVEQGFTFSFREHLRVADLVDPSVFRHDRRAHTDRSGPRPAPYLINADHDLVSQIPHAAFHRQIGGASLQGLAEARYGRGHGERIPGAGGAAGNSVEARIGRKSGIDGQPSALSGQHGAPEAFGLGREPVIR